MPISRVALIKLWSEALNCQGSCHPALMFKHSPNEMLMHF